MIISVKMNTALYAGTFNQKLRGTRLQETIIGGYLHSKNVLQGESLESKNVWKLDLCMFNIRLINKQSMHGSQQECFRWWVEAVNSE